MIKKFIPDDYHENIRKFQYKSINHSLVYKYFVSPFGDLLVSKVIPDSIA